jgi:DNA invertase Pin-like site-specific DNA recombinase
MTPGDKPRRVALYARVSTEDQKCENQLLDLRRFGQERGWQVQGEYVDEGISGTKASRPGLDRLMDAARKRQVDTVLVWRFDRFARSVKHLVLALTEFRELGVQFVSYQENVDTGSPLGQAIYTIIAAMAQLERDIIVERVRAGLRRAKADGRKLGRPRCQVDLDRLSQLREQGLSLGKIAKALGVSKATVFRLVPKSPPASAAVQKPGTPEPLSA